MSDRNEPYLPDSREESSVSWRARVDALEAAHQRIATLEAQLETERLRLAACGTAALGYYKRGDPIHPDYNSASLDDVLNLREKLAQVMQERDALKEKVASQVEELNTIIRKKWEVEEDRDAVRRNEAEYLTARARGFRACDLDEPLENCANERYQHEQEGWASGWMERAVQRERDTLRADLRAVAEAAENVHNEILDRPDQFDIDDSIYVPFRDALARPGVVAVLQEGGDEPERESRI